MTGRQNGRVRSFTQCRMGLLFVERTVYRYGGKDISFIRKNGHILRGGEHMQAKGLFLNYKKNRRLMQYFFKIRELV